MIRFHAFSRRQCLSVAFGAATSLAFGAPIFAAQPASFAGWVSSFRARAVGAGISEATYNRVMNNITPDTSVFELQRAQPEFTEPLWQYINRRCSDFRVIRGKERIKELRDLLGRIERDYGVERHGLVGLWGMESSFGDVIDNMKYMRPVLPALAALAWGEPRRRKYWEQELLNALRIVDRGWAQPNEMIGSWAGAMGHTQWMPEVWLNIGIDYDNDGKANPFGKPDDSLAGTARYLVQRGRYARGEAWGCEAKIPAGRDGLADKKTWRTYEQWQGLGVTRADGVAFARPQHRVRLWLPISGGPAFLIGQNYYAYRSYNPSDSYTLALVHLGDLIRGDGPLRQQFPSGERVPTIDEMKEIQRRLTEKGFPTDGTDGRAGGDTVKAVRAYQKKVGMEPSDGYPGLKVLARLRQAS